MRTISIKSIIAGVIAAAAALTASQSCKKTEVEPFSGRESVYFELGAKWADMPDSLVYSFYSSTNVTTPTQKIVELKVRVLGDIADYDREVKIELDREIAAGGDGAVSGVHFEALPSTVTVKAGVDSTFIPVKFLYVSDMDTKEFQMGIYLRENDYFGLKIPKRDHIRLYISNMAIRPSYWLDTRSPSNAYTYFGPYSRVKQQKIEEVLNVVFPDTWDEMYADSYIWTVRGTVMKQWFTENKTYDETGREILPW